MFCSSCHTALYLCAKCGESGCSTRGCRNQAVATSRCTSCNSHEVHRR